MDAKYILGIDELDAQHEGIERDCLALRESVGDPERWHRLLDQIYEKMKFHFHAEESVMAIFAYPETQEHRRSHQEILKCIEACRQRTVDAVEIEACTEQPMQLFQV